MEETGRPDGGQDQTNRPAAAPKPARELKVEDALIYLDQVKMEFSDKPHIYNEFLDIMKNFKAQSIKTPGVIERVKNLFRGYNKLILGFNTFLPEGEGYKIELTPEEQEYTPSDNLSVQMGSVQRYPPSSANASSHIGPIPAAMMGHTLSGMQSMSNFTAPAKNIPAEGQQNSGLSGPEMDRPKVGPVGLPGGIGMVGNPSAATGFGFNMADLNMMRQNPNPANPGMANPAAAGPALGNVAVPPQQMQQAHAIHYVTKIRSRFSNEPETYRSFLKILHTYQKEQKGIKEVLEQVSHLFADHPDLLMEFTFFLPDAVQDQAKERLNRAARESEQRKIAARYQQQANKQGPNKKTAMNRQEALMMMGQSVVQGPGGVLMAPTGPDGALVPIPMKEGALAGTKRSRAEREAMAPRLNNLTPQQQQQLIGNAYQMALATGSTGMGMEDLQAQQMAMNFGKGYKIGPGGVVAGPNGQPKKQNRRSKAQLAAAAATANASNAATNGAAAALGDTQSNQIARGPTSTASNGAFYSNKTAARGSLMTVSAERKFFEQVKDTLMSGNSSSENWIEFIKCLELFTQDSMSKENFLDSVEDLFRPAHMDLFDEFKKLIDQRSEYDAHQHDLWYAVPLSEIDFSQCRKCTPSYRALPRDYPKSKCTERSKEEQNVLNDQWVSIPIGSEESYSFKHMRKNQYEEALFKCEDERFEIDMIIDSNMSTIRMLEPLAEEIQSIKRIDEKSNRDGATPKILTPRFSLHLEKRQLSTIHLNAITRIYGDHGEEILELLRKNPAGTIPVILKRLKQKDLEWRKARKELNKHWSEVVEKNFHKSFDHRSFYFRQQDKKYLSTRQFVSDLALPLNTVVANAAATVPTAAIASSGASTVSCSVVPPPPIEVSDPSGARDSDSSGPAPGVSYNIAKELEPYLAGMKPNLVLDYDNDAHLIHRDIYRIMCHAAEHTLSSSSDKERLAALWRDLLRVFFGMPAHYLYSSLTAPVLTGSDEAEKVLPVIDASEAWPVGTRVATVYGSGLVLDFRATDSMYVIQLAFGKAHLSPTVVYGSEQLPPQALQAIGVAKKDGKDVIFGGSVKGAANEIENGKSKSDGTTTPMPAQLKPSAFRVKHPSKLFYGTQMSYIFLRLHHTLYMRLKLARTLSQEMQDEYRSRGVSSPAMRNTKVLLAHLDAIDTEGNIIDGADKSSLPVYNHFLGQVYSLVEGTIDNSKFEEFCRVLLGNKSYVLFTLDKLVSMAIKHLQAMANDENVSRLVGLFVYHHNNGLSNGTPLTTNNNTASANGRPVLKSSSKDSDKNSKSASANAKASTIKANIRNGVSVNDFDGPGADSILYRNHAAHILSHTMEDVYRIQMITTGSNVSGQQSQVAVQHLGVLTTEQIYSPPTVAGAKLVTTTDGVVLAGSSSPKTGLSFLSGDAMDIVSSAGLVPEVAVATISMNSADSVHNLSSMAVHRAPKAVVPDDDEDEDEDNKNTTEDEEEEEEDAPARKVLAFTPRG